MPFRETFWNIPHWLEITQYLLGFVTILIFVYGVMKHVRCWKQGQPELLTGSVWQRFVHFIAQAIGQARTLQDVYPGIMHLALFWGMIVLFIGTVLATVDWDVTRLFFGYQFLAGNFYLLFELILDIFGVVVLLGLGLEAFRRYIIRPTRLSNLPVGTLGWQDVYILSMLFLIVVTGYLVEGLRLAVIQPEWAIWSPIGNAVASIFIASGDPTNLYLHLIIWISHMLVAFIFIASIPYTKLFHIISTPVNIFCSDQQSSGKLIPASSGSGSSINDWHQFSWKQLLEFDACTRCGRCQDCCPAYASNQVLSPRNLIIKLANYIWNTNSQKSLHGEVIKPNELWSCTTCLACVQICPAFVNQLRTIVDLRRHLVDEGDMDNKLQEALTYLGRYGNSFGQSDRFRAKWAQQIQPKIKDARLDQVEYLWFVGDFASYHSSLNEITQKTAAIFQRAGMNFGIMYEGEHNAGNDVRRVGEEGLWEILVEHNEKMLSRCKFRAIITTDPHTYHTLKNEYKSNSGEMANFYPVLHYSELLDQLVHSGQLKFNKKLDYQVTYHDPCYLGRYNRIYAAPRRLIAATGCKLVEMSRHSQNAFCCGAGGGRIWMEENVDGERPSEIRVREAARLEGVTILAVACPKDVTMFSDAIKTTGLENHLRIRDISELIYEAL